MVESSNGKKSNISLKRDVVLCKSVEIFIFIVRRNGFCVFNPHRFGLSDFHFIGDTTVDFYVFRFSLDTVQIFLILVQIQ